MQPLLDNLKAAMASVDGVVPTFGKLSRKTTFPCIRYLPVGGESAGHLRGESDLRNTLIQVDCFARTLGEAWSLAEHARRQLTCAPLYGTIQVAPFSLAEEGLDAERVSFQISIWGQAS